MIYMCCYTTSMPEIVNQIPIVGIAQRYPWNEWADGQTRAFYEGVDFVTSPRTFYATASAWCNRTGHRYGGRVDNKARVVYLRIEPKPTPPAEGEQS